ncbi:hypothetical protein F4827_002626 [Paraburkholderia bannensis]|uniref:Uncharacterized protein n=1 Tax=Paraburkholderia bannensis TaxID=765414 RepID=A0A7W9TX82_9BURK|nr:MULTISPECIES: hypothetical protein [Paraburkholderia]MBB3257761.1 hypothetical protein [Paraburkholderia sp. WP4_3_2]MBB6102774.1 hypothetical protein [Paraburkholderia bannensis]
MGPISRAEYNTRAARNTRLFADRESIFEVAVRWPRKAPPRSRSIEHLARLRTHGLGRADHAARLHDQLADLRVAPVRGLLNQPELLGVASHRAATR